jgi:hypothetical protein
MGDLMERLSDEVAVEVADGDVEYLRVAVRRRAAAQR